MAKITSLTEQGAKRNDPRSCFEVLPKQIQGSLLALVALENQHEANSHEGEISELLLNQISRTRKEIHNVAIAEKIPLARVEYATNYLRGRPAGEVRILDQAPSP